MLDDPDPREPWRRELPDPAFWGPDEDEPAGIGRLTWRGHHRRRAPGTPELTAARPRLAPRRMRVATVTAIPATAIIGAVVYLVAPTSSAGLAGAAENSAAVSPHGLLGPQIRAVGSAAPAPAPAPAPSAAVARHSLVPALPVAALFPASAARTTLPIPAPVLVPAAGASPVSPPATSPTAAPSPATSSSATASPPATASPSPASSPQPDTSSPAPAPTDTATSAAPSAAATDSPTPDPSAS